MATNSAGGRDLVRREIGRVRGAVIFVAVFSAVVNILMLTGPIFMLQIYDRVLTSRSVPTLLALLALTAALFALMGLFDFLRGRILSRAAHKLDDRLSAISFRAWMVRSLGSHIPGYKPIQDLAAMRGFIASPTILALFDLPWFPIYLAVIFVLHIQLGLLATAGAVVVIILALLNERVTSHSAGLAAKSELVEGRFADQAQTGADGVVSMGMLGNALGAWRGLHDQALVHQQRASERSGAFTATSKAFRLLLQSAILGLGAYLAIHQEITPGMIVAASIIAGRALAPIDQTIGGWRMIKRARIARTRLTDFLRETTDDSPQGVELPAPQGHILISDVTKSPPAGGRTGESRPILSDISFALEPGDGLGVIGPSASGKSSLAKLLVGLWMPDQGSVRIDGATFEQWDPDRIGPHIGYLPQSVTLLSGTIGQNIARFDPEAKNEDIVEAARLAGVHEMILRFPEAYETSVDDAISPLTGGQKQRIALARAIFRKPVLVVLDEPNSNLDAEGDAALAATVRALREAGSVVIVMAHRPSAIAAVDKVVVLDDGRVAEFGDKASVLRRATRAA